MSKMCSWLLCKLKHFDIMCIKKYSQVTEINSLRFCIDSIILIALIWKTNFKPILTVLK